MSQAFSLYGDLTVRENLDFFAELRGVARHAMEERAKRLLEFSGLTEFAKRQAQFLSGGMKQKLALAATLISEPDLLFLDEPTTGVDPVSRREFWRIISDLHRQGITVFVATPYMDEAERCNEIAFMTQGRIILRDTPAGMKRRVPGRMFEVAVSDYRRAMALVRSLPFVTSVEVSGELLRVLVGKSMDAAGARGRAAGGAGRRGLRGRARARGAHRSRDGVRDAHARHDDRTGERRGSWRCRDEPHSRHRAQGVHPHHARPRGSSPSILLMPLIQLFLFSYALSFNVKNIPTAVLDQDNSSYSRQYVAALQQSNYFTGRPRT